MISSLHSISIRSLKKLPRVRVNATLPSSHHPQQIKIEPYNSPYIYYQIPKGDFYSFSTIVEHPFSSLPFRFFSLSLRKAQLLTRCIKDGLFSDWVGALGLLQDTKRVDIRESKGAILSVH
jgi:hypothetical protein